MSPTSLSAEWSRSRVSVMNYVDTLSAVDWAWQSRQRRLWRAHHPCLRRRAPDPQSSVWCEQITAQTKTCNWYLTFHIMCQHRSSASVTNVTANRTWFAASRPARASLGQLGSSRGQLGSSRGQARASRGQLGYHEASLWHQQISSVSIDSDTSGLSLVSFHQQINI